MQNVIIFENYRPKLSNTSLQSILSILDLVVLKSHIIAVFPKYTTKTGLNTRHIFRSFFFFIIFMFCKNVILETNSVLNDGIENYMIAIIDLLF